MILKKMTLAAVTLGFLSACGTPTKTAEQQEYDYYERAADALKKGDCQQASSVINGLFIYTTNNRLKQLFKEHSNAENCIINVYVDDIKATTGINKINAIRFNLDKMYSLQAISGNTIEKVDKIINDSVEDKIRNGSINISFDDSIKNHAFLNKTEIMDLIATNTINNYKNKNHYNKSGLQQLVDYVASSPINSTIRGNLKESLPLMNLKINELTIVEKIDPNFVSEQRKVSTLNAYIEYKSIDRLTADDIGDVIKKAIKGVQWVNAGSNFNNIISIEKIRHAEVTGQERMQTISYADYQVDRMAAVLLMPRNASYLFDLVSNEISVDYGYVITYQKEGKKVSEEVVRGTESHQNKRCQNQRIQNVFGGNQAADFIANDDMRSKCASSNKTIDAIRSDIYSKIAYKILEIEDVKRVHSMNQ